MKTSMINVLGKKLFVVDTEIAKTAYREGITNTVVKDEKTGMRKFKMGIDLSAEIGSIMEGGVTVNGVNDEGNFVIYMSVGANETIEDIKKAYGALLVKAAEELEVLKAQMAAEATAIDGIFAGVAAEDAE